MTDGHDANCAAEDDIRIARRVLEDGDLRHAAFHVAAALSTSPHDAEALALADALLRQSSDPFSLAPIKRDENFTGHRGVARAVSAAKAPARRSPAAHRRHSACHAETEFPGMGLRLDPGVGCGVGAAAAPPPHQGGLGRLRSRGGERGRSSPAQGIRRPAAPSKANSAGPASFSRPAAWCIARLAISRARWPGVNALTRRSPIS
jgi:hypothetical protein